MVETGGTDGLRLVDLVEAGEAAQWAMLDLRNDPQVRNFMIAGGEIGRAGHAEWLKSLAGSARTKVFAAMIGDELAGQANLSGIDRENGHAEWGFFVAPAMRGRGVAREMLSKLLDLAFGEIGLQKVNAGVLDDNPASLMLHDRFGFRREGVRRRHKRRADGFADLVLYGITAQEWTEARGQTAAPASGRK